MSDSCSSWRSHQSSDFIDHQAAVSRDEPNIADGQGRYMYAGASRINIRPEAISFADIMRSMSVRTKNIKQRMT